ncbi:phosphate ABC transporter substrate-binding protein PstS, partial [Mesorhizobium sp. J18]|uniref:phosphate ABC transporter substrate-binding protein PstS n=1 Tax=Mesorhizobium sp. J18 TaxID=935263 RepID=UPI0011A38EF0
SLAGIMRLAQPNVDFAATDAPLSPEEVTQRGWTQFPIVMGGIVIVANIDGVAAGELRLSGEAVADIYLGKITKWSDPAIVELNPDLNLPDAEIVVLHRADGSGSTFTFASFLAKSSSEWKEKLGADTLIAWPLGRAEKGTGGLAAAAATTKNSIAYLEYGQVVRAGLPFVSLRNEAGEFVRPEPAAFQAGLGAVDWDPGKHFHADTTSLPGAGAYPMAAVTYAIVPRDRSGVRIGRVLDLFRIAYGQGSDKASALGYIPIPPELAGRIEDYWAVQFDPAQN